jgi:hypothetical protein
MSNARLNGSAIKKGAVESLVGWVKGSSFQASQFRDELDLQARLDAWHVEVNTNTPCRATNVIPETR